MANFTSTSGSYTTTLTVTQTSQSTQNNQSTLTYSLTLTKNSGTGLWNNNSCPWSITIDGSTVASGSFTYDFRSYSSLTLKGSTTTTVTHNSDGTKTVACSASVNMGNEPYVYVMKPSGDLALTTIPRASDVSVSNYSIANTSGSISATITSKASFYHKWRWRMNSGSWSSWTNKGLIASTSSTVTVANTTLLAQLPTATSGSFNIEVATYSDSRYATLVGTKSASATVSVNTANIKPSVSLGNIGLNSTPITNYAVAGYSKVQSAWTTTNSSGASSVTTYLSTSHGTLGTTSSTSTSGTTVSGVIPSSSANYTLTISAYAKDSRGATSSTVSKSITVYGYTPPTATLNAYRVASSSSTTEDGAGTYAYVTFSGAVSSSVNSQNTIQSKTCTYSGSISGTATNGGHYALADTQSVTFKLTVTDKVTSSTVSVSIATARYALDLYDNGNGTVGVGLGAVAVGGYVTTSLNINTLGNDIILGTSGTGSNDSGDIQWWYGNGNEKMRIWSSNAFTQKQAPYFREYDESGNSLYSGNLVLGDGTGASGTWGINVSGKATTADQVKIVTNNPVRSSVRYLPFVTGTSGDLIEYANADLKLEMRAGTASTEGYMILQLGNSTDKGVDGNKWGAIDVYPQYGANVCRLYANRTTASRYVSLPDGSGTLAVVSTLWTGSLIGGGNQITLTDAMAYARLRIYAFAGGGDAWSVWEIDVPQITTTARHFAHSMPMYISNPGDWYLSIFDITCLKSGKNVVITFVNAINKRIGTSGQTTQNTSNYRIYRIDGII